MEAQVAHKNKNNYKHINSCYRNKTLVVTSLTIEKEGFQDGGDCSTRTRNDKKMQAKRV
jgi:hypothetical protein